MKIIKTMSTGDLVRRTGGSLSPNRKRFETGLVIKFRKTAWGNEALVLWAFSRDCSSWLCWDKLEVISESR